MNSIDGTGGLLARQKTNTKRKELVLSVWNRTRRCMFLVSIAGMFFILSSCDKNSHGQIAQDNAKDKSTAISDTLNKPKVNIQVNRRYDDKGNLIGFDSTYSSFYSNVKGDTAEMDSLMNTFDRYFNLNHSSFFDRQFNRLFFSDSLRYPDFFHKDFFMKRYELNDQYLRDMTQRMDSIKNRFFQEHSKTWRESRDL